MPEIYPDPHRAEIARILDSMETEVIEDTEIHHADLVRDLEDPQKYAARSLSEEGNNHTGGTPRHWRILIPSQVNPFGLRCLEFGLSAKDMTGQSRTDSAFDQRQFLDETIDTNEDSPAVRLLFANIGGFVVQAARDAGHKMFAGLEIRYKIDEDSGNTLMWAHLYYSRILEGVARYVKLTPERDYPEWLLAAASERNGSVAAESVALGALLVQRKAQQQLD